MPKTIFTLIIVIASFITFSSAQDRFELADQELNSSYQKLMGELSPSQKKILRNAQRAWITFIDNDCRMKAELSQKSLITCKTIATEDRTQEFIRLFFMNSTSKQPINLDLVDNIKQTLSNLSTIPITKINERYWPNGSTHTILSQLLKEISFSYIANLYKKPIFRQGPHGDHQLNLSSQSSFGFYEPEFLLWLENHLTVTMKDEQFISMSKSMVDKYLINTVHLYIMSYHYLKDNPDIYSNLFDNYQSQYHNQAIKDNHHYAFYTNSKSPITQYEWFTINLQNSFNSDGYKYVAVGSAIFFWMRRGMDGTDQQFITLLKEFYGAYNLQKLLEIESGNYRAPSDLPLGKLNF